MTHRPPNDQPHSRKPHLFRAKVVAVALAGALAFTGLISDTERVISETDATWTDSEYASVGIQAATVPYPATVECVGARTISWEEPDTTVPIHGYILEIEQQGILNLSGTMEIEDPAQNTAFINSTLLGVISGLVASTYEVRVKTVGPEGWESRLSEEAGHFQTFLLSSPECA